MEKVNSWSEAIKSLSPHAFEKMLNMKRLENKITVDQMYALLTQYRLKNRPATKKDIEEIFNTP